MSAADAFASAVTIAIGPPKSRARPNLYSRRRRGQPALTVEMPAPVPEVVDLTGEASQPSPGHVLVDLTVDPTQVDPVFTSQESFRPFSSFPEVSTQDAIDAAQSLMEERDLPASPDMFVPDNLPFTEHQPEWGGYYDNGDDTADAADDDATTAGSVPPSPSLLARPGTSYSAPIKSSEKLRPSLIPVVTIEDDDDGDSPMDVAPDMTYAPNPKRTRTVFGASSHRHVPVPAPDFRRKTTSTQAKTAPDKGKYLKFCRELNMPCSSVLRMVYLRQFRGEVYVGVRNIAPHRGYVTEANVDTSIDVKPMGLFMPLDVWGSLCSLEIRKWVDNAIGTCINESGLHDAQVWHSDPKEVEGSFITEDGERRAPLGRNKWVTVKLFKGVVYVGLREFYWSGFLQKTVPGRGINLDQSEWVMLEKYMLEVNEFLASL
jgi:hypothetical protein